MLCLILCQHANLLKLAKELNFIIFSVLTLRLVAFALFGRELKKYKFSFLLWTGPILHATAFKGAAEGPGSRSRC